MSEFLANFISFYDEFDGELKSTTDRGAVILGTSGLDTLLSNLLAASTVQSSKGVQGAVFDDFSSKVTCAFLFGLISEDERRELRLVGKIRNKIAHEISADLHSSPLRDQCMELKFCDRHYIPAAIPFMVAPDGTKYIPDPLPDPSEFPDVQVSMDDPTDPRERLVASVRGLVDCLFARIQLATRPDAPAEFETDEPRLQLLQLLEHGERLMRDLLAEREDLETRLANLPDSPEKDALLADLAARKGNGKGQKVNTPQANDMMMAIGRYGYEVVRENRRRQNG